jgi:hypothetical protein
MPSKLILFSNPTNALFNWLCLHMSMEYNFSHLNDVNTHEQAIFGSWFDSGHMPWIGDPWWSCRVL